MKSHGHPYHESLGGSWWCLICRAPAQIEDPGEAQPLCGICGHRKCVWESTAAPFSIVKTPAPIPEPVPDDAAPIVNVRRLPREERPTLSQMTYQGYWLCLACRQPTKKNSEDCCVLCGSSQVEFQPPTVTTT